jgi:hypothetical protein
VRICTAVAIYRTQVVALTLPLRFVVARASLGAAAKAKSRVSIHVVVAAVTELPALGVALARILRSVVRRAFVMPEPCTSHRHTNALAGRWVFSSARTTLYGTVGITLQRGLGIRILT